MFILRHRRQAGLVALQAAHHEVGIPVDELHDAAFVLGRLREDASRIEAEVQGAKAVIASSSPGLALAALEKAMDDGCAIEAHDRMTIDGDTWTLGGICALAHDALTSKED